MNLDRPMLTIDDLVMDYPGHPGAVDGVSLQANEGEFLTLLGPSGCGKSTILRCVAGLEDPTRGRIDIGGTEVFGRSGRVPTHRRNIGMVFQSYAIWPHMTVLENVRFPLDHLSRDESRQRALEALQMVDLERFGDRPATMLSGGQQQRVAFARAVVRGADLLLLDEPLSNLDAALRAQMRAELRDLQQRLGTTTVYVTHDQEEALGLSDRVVVLDGGKVVEVGRPEELYTRPRTTFTASFVGQAQLWPCSRVQPDDDGVMVTTALGPFRVQDRLPPAASEGRSALLIRPEHWQVLPVGGEAPAANEVEGEITAVTFTGKLLDLEVRCGSAGTVHVQELAGTLHRVGERTRLRAPVERCVLLTDGPDVPTPSA